MDGQKPPSKPPTAETKPDVVVLGPPTADGAGVHVLRARDEKVEAGELRAIAEGKPIVGEIVALEPRKDDPRVCDVRSSYKPPPGAILSGPRKGPAQVANDAYRDNWDEIFQKKTTPDSSLN